MSGIVAGELVGALGTAGFVIMRKSPVEGQVLPICKRAGAWRRVFRSLWHGASGAGAAEMQNAKGSASTRSRAEAEVAQHETFAVICEMAASASPSPNPQGRLRPRASGAPRRTAQVEVGRLFEQLLPRVPNDGHESLDERPYHERELCSKLDEFLLDIDRALNRLR
jgi:hypothetical protein